MVELNVEISFEVPDSINVNGKEIPFELGEFGGTYWITADERIVVDTMDEMVTIYPWVDALKDKFGTGIVIDDVASFGKVQGIIREMERTLNPSYNASAKKSQPNKLRVKADMAFSEMVAKQRTKNESVSFFDMVNKQRNKNLKKQVDSSGIEFADTHISEIAEKVIKTANRIIELDAEIKEGYMESPQMPYDLMQELFSNIYSLDAYRQLLEDKYKVWVARFERE